MRKNDKILDPSKKGSKNKLKKDSPEYCNGGGTVDDIYRQKKQEMEMDSEHITPVKPPNEKMGTKNEKDFKDDMSGNALDVTDSELDDQQESFGSDDAENSYYNWGGDHHIMI